MTEHSREPIVTLGIDLAKRSFHLFGVDAHQGNRINIRE